MSEEAPAIGGIAALAIDCTDPLGLAHWWRRLLGGAIDADPQGDVVTLHTPAGLALDFLRVPEPKTGKNRVHIDLASWSAEDQAAQVNRLLSLGATRADIGQGDVPFVVLADPEGNEFCVLDPRPVYADTGPVAAVVVDSADPAAQARVWSRAAGWVPQQENADFASLRSPSGVGPFLEFLRTPDAKTVKHRIHLDVRPYPGEDYLDEARQLQELGAVPADVGQGDVRWVVLADPEGGEFCVLTPR